MSEKDLVTLCFSGLALLISVYGILERGLATRRAVRLRLTELIDDLAQIDVDQRVIVEDPGKSDGMKTALRNGNAARRALLAAQAVDLLAKYRRRVTVPEYIILAEALRETSDTAGQRHVLAMSVGNLSKDTLFQQSAAWRQWAWFNFEQGDVNTARRAIRRSLELVTPVDDIGRLERFENLLTWFESEFLRNAGESAYQRAILDEADTVLGSVQDTEWRHDRLERTRLSRERLEAREAMGGAPPTGSR